MQYQQQQEPPLPNPQQHPNQQHFPQHHPSQPSSQYPPPPPPLQQRPPSSTGTSSTRHDRSLTQWQRYLQWDLVQIHKVQQFMYSHPRLKEEVDKVVSSSPWNDIALLNWVIFFGVVSRARAKRAGAKEGL